MHTSTLHRHVLRYAAILLAAGCRDAVSAPDGATQGLRPNTPLAAAASRDIVPTGKGIDIIDDPNPPARTRYKIESHTGSVLLNIQDVYFIWYGDWTGKDADQLILTDLASNIGNTPYLNIAKLYADASGNTATSSVVYGGSVTDAGSHGTVISDADIFDIVDKQLSSFALPSDPQGIFVVMAAPNVTASSGQGSTYCAMHGARLFYGTQGRFIYIGAPSRWPSHCAAQLRGPNGTIDGDGAAYLFAAELANVLTDPYLNSWYDRLGLEAADKCLWTYGTFYTAPNGAAANIHLGQRDFLLPQIWAPSKNGGACAMHW
jgi:hypothetical protein